MSVSLGVSALQEFKLSLRGIPMCVCVGGVVAQGLLLGADENSKTNNSVSYCILKHSYPHR